MSHEQPVCLARTNCSIKYDEQQRAWKDCEILCITLSHNTQTDIQSHLGPIDVSGRE